MTATPTQIPVSQLGFSSNPGNTPVANAAVKVTGNPQVLGANGQPIPGAPSLDASGNIIPNTGTQSGGGFIGTGQSTTNPTVTSANTRATYDALGNDISSMFNTTSIQNNSDKEAALLKSYQDKLDANFGNDTSGIKAAYDQASKVLQEQQVRRYGSQSASLVTSGGGFLGNTGSHTGVLNSLNDTFVQEQQALMSKRDIALQAARSAYDDKNFSLAKQQLDLAKQTQQDIYGRQKDQNEYQLQIAGENRAQSTFVQAQVDRIASSIASMSAQEFAKADPDQIRRIDSQYYPGYAKHLNEVTQKALAKADLKDEVSIQKDIYEMLSKIPAGRNVTIAGKTYVGLKAAAGTVASLKGAITPLQAQIAGLPASVVGLPQKDIILSLELTRPAQWFVNTIQQQQGQSIPAESLTATWESFRNDPNIVKYRNTVKLDNRNGIGSGNLSFTGGSSGLSSEDQAILDE